MAIKKRITSPGGNILFGVVIIVSLQYPALAESWYPKTAQPYPGTAFHCDLKPLPPDMPGIKSEDKEFVDHACSVLLKCAQEKELMLTSLNNNQAEAALSRYETATSAQLQRLKSVTAPPGLESFKSDVDKAITLQMTFFRKATKARAGGANINTVMGIPEGRQASQLLFSAWDEMQKRYWFFWSGNTKDCIYHHLCAFDLF